MTRDEAKSVLFDMLGKGIYVKNTKENQAILAALRAMEQEPKTGRWIYTGDYITDGMLKCSSCGYEHDVADRFLYCPNCGAKMVEPQAESKEKTCKNCINAKECVMYDPNMKRCREYKADPKEIYNKGFADGQKALAEHLKLCKEELLDEIRAEIDEQYDRIHPNNIYTAEGLEIALDIIDKYKAESGDK